MKNLSAIVLMMLSLTGCSLFTRDTTAHRDQNVEKHWSKTTTAPDGGVTTESGVESTVATDDSTENRKSGIDDAAIATAVGLALKGAGIGVIPIKKDWSTEIAGGIAGLTGVAAVIAKLARDVHVAKRDGDEAWDTIHDIAKQKAAEPTSA